MRRRVLFTTVLALALSACALTRPATPNPQPLPAPQHRTLTELLPTDALILGEQHDVPEHQQLHLAVTQTLLARAQLATLALEMSSQGLSTQALGPDASDDAVRQALQWQDDAWPWAAYGPAVMAAVRAGVPVVGANLPTPRLREVMGDAALDGVLTPAALAAQQAAIRTGHCDLLPERQVMPMTRVQLARDAAMASTLVAHARPGQTVLLLAGSGHADRALGVPQHTPQGFTVKSVLLHANAGLSAPDSGANFDHIWVAGNAPEVDYCAQLQPRLVPAAATSAPPATH